MGFKSKELSSMLTMKANLRKIPGQGVAFGRQDMQFPGQGNLFPPTKTIEEIRDFIKNQKKTKGFNFSVPTGDQDFPIQVSGEARLMLGFSIMAIDQLNNVALQPATVSLLINNEIVIDKVHPGFYSPLFMDEEYYLFLRPLSGQDDISFTFVNPNANQNVAVAFYYL